MDITKVKTALAAATAELDKLYETAVQAARKDRAAAGSLPLLGKVATQIEKAEGVLDKIAERNAPKKEEPAAPAKKK